MGKAIKYGKGKAYQLKWWQVGLISISVSFLGGLSGLLSSKKQQHIYKRELKQAPWAPPGWLFAPAWTINNFFLLLGIQRLIKSSDVPEKKKLIALQVMIWVIFFSFNYVYFRKKSPLLAAAWTMSDTVFSAASLIIARKMDTKISLTYLPLTIWTAFASTLAGYQALKNPDPVFKTKALLT